MEEYFRIGIITSPHGIKGEVNVYPTTDDMNRFNTIEYVFVDHKGNRTKMNVTEVKFFKAMAILKLENINSITEAECFRNAELFIHRSQSSPCKEGEYFVSDLIGMKVFREENGELLGTLTDVYLTGANNVYEVTKPSGKQVLLPKIPDCIKKVDVENGEMTVFVLPGLED